MSVPIIYYGNALLSGTLGAENSGDASLVARVRDGSVTLPYAITISGAGDRHGIVNLTLPAAISTTDRALIFPRCDLASGVGIVAFSYVTSGGAPSFQVLDSLEEDKSFYLSDFTSPGDDHAFFSVEVWGVAATPGFQYVSEIIIAQKYTLPRSPEVSVTRTRVRQFNRIEVRGSEPFTRRAGPLLRQTSMNFTVLSGSEIDALRGFVDGVEGGEAFTLVDDLGAAYWAELLDSDVPEQDDAGVSTVSLTFQEIKIDDE